MWEQLGLNASTFLLDTQLEIELAYVRSAWFSLRIKWYNTLRLLLYTMTCKKKKKEGQEEEEKSPAKTYVT